MMTRIFLTCWFPVVLFFSLISCGKPVQEGELHALKSECPAAVDERCYAEMTEYTVLKDEKKLQALKASGKVITLPASRKVRILKRKIDIAQVEYRSRHGKKQVWVAVKYLR